MFRNEISHFVISYLFVGLGSLPMFFSLVLYFPALLGIRLLIIIVSMYSSKLELFDVLYVEDVWHRPDSTPSMLVSVDTTRRPIPLT